MKESKKKEHDMKSNNKDMKFKGKRNQGGK